MAVIFKWLFLLNETLGIKADSLHFDHILMISFQIQCGGIQKQNYDNCVNV